MSKIEITETEAASIAARIKRETAPAASASLPPCPECGGGEVITMTDGKPGWRCACSDMPVPLADPAAEIAALREALKSAVAANMHTVGNSDEPSWLDGARAALKGAAK